MMLGMRAQVLRGCCLLMLAAGGCGDDVSSASEGSTGATTEPGTSGATEAATTSASTTADPPTSTTDAPTTDADDSSDGGFEPTDPECGNGFVEADEQCDDANDDDQDGCTSACEFQCGLQWSTVTLAPTDQSLLDARGIAETSEGGVVVVGFQREVTTDQRGNQTIANDDATVIMLDADGEELWSTRLGVDDENLDVTGVAVDDAGDVYVSATVGPLQEDDDIQAFKLAGDDGSVLWTFVQDSAVDSAEDISFGIAMGPDGNPVVTGQVRAGPGDDDIWVGKIDASNGEALWTSTWSGMFSGMFSTDDGGPIAVGPDGSVYVLASEYVDFETQPVTLVAFDADGGEATLTHTPDVGTGSQDMLPSDVSVAPDGQVLITFIRILGGGNEFYTTRFDPDAGEETWRVDQQLFAESSVVKNAANFSLVGAEGLPEGGVLVSGLLARSEKGATWTETWVARLDDAGAIGCMFVRESPQLSLVPGSLIGRAVSAGADESALVAAQQIEDGAESLWVGSFRPE